MKVAPINTPRWGKRCARWDHHAFTLIELLVVVTIILVLLSLLLPVLTKGKQKGQGAHCLSNLRQLQFAWHMYADDNQGGLVPNRHGKQIMGPTPAGDTWVSGWLDWTSSSHNTNAAFLTEPHWSLLAQYLNHSAAIFKCPADKYQSSQNPGRRVRSNSMNATMGPGNNKTEDPGSDKSLICATLSDIPDPANNWVFIDEHPDSINDGCFFVDPEQQRWLDLPATYHDGAGGITFADGHAEIKKWIEPSTKRRIVMVEGNYSPFNPKGARDIQWLQAKTPRRQ